MEHWTGLAVRSTLIRFTTVAAIFLIAAPLTTSGQPAVRVPQVGSLSTGSPATSPLRGDLAALGYVEGKTIILHLRYADGRGDRLPALAAELVQLNAVVALAHALLRIAYHVLADGTVYRELGGDYYDRRYRQRVTRRAIHLLEPQGYRVILEPA